MLGDDELPLPLIAIVDGSLLFGIVLELGEERLFGCGRGYVSFVYVRQGISQLVQPQGLIRSRSVRGALT